MSSPFIKKNKDSPSLPKHTTSLHTKELFERSEKALEKLKKVLFKME